MAAEVRFREIVWGRFIAAVAGWFGLLSLALAAYVVVRGWPIAEGKEVGQIGFLALMFLTFGIGAGILAVWTWRNPSAPRVPEAIADEHSWTMADFRRDLDETEDWPKGKPGGFWWRQASPKFAEDPARHVDELRELTVKCPRNLLFSHTLILGLIAGNQLAKAKEEIVRITRRPVYDGTATLLLWFLLEHLFSNSEPTAFETTVNECLPHLPARGRPVVLDYSACRCFMTRPELQRLDLADRFSAEAIRLAPQLVTIQGTRGSVLAELGRLDEAEALLGPVFETANPGINRAYSALYLAVIWSRRGQKGKAKEFAQEAQRNEPAGFVIDRLKAEGL